MGKTIMSYFNFNDYSSALRINVANFLQPYSIIDDDDLAIDNNNKIILSHEDNIYLISTNGEDEIYLNSNLSGLVRHSTDLQTTDLLDKTKVNYHYVTNMHSAFANCYNLEGIPVSAKRVRSMYGTYYNCGNLSGTIKINANVNNLIGTYYNCINVVDVPSTIKNVRITVDSFYNCSKIEGAPADMDLSRSLMNTYYNCYLLSGNPANCNNAVVTINAYYNCPNLYGNFYWYNDCFDQADKMNATNMFYNRNCDNKLNIYVELNSGVLNALINYSATYGNIYGVGELEWTVINNEEYPDYYYYNNELYNTNVIPNLLFIPLNRFNCMDEVRVSFTNTLISSTSVTDWRGSGYNNIYNTNTFCRVNHFKEILLNDDYILETFTEDQIDSKTKLTTMDYNIYLYGIINHINNYKYNFDNGNFYDADTMRIISGNVFGMVNYTYINYYYTKYTDSRGIKYWNQRFYQNTLTLDTFQVKYVDYYLTLDNQDFEDILFNPYYPRCCWFLKKDSNNILNTLLLGDTRKVHTMDYAFTGYMLSNYNTLYANMNNNVRYGNNFIGLGTLFGYKSSEILGDRNLNMFFCRLLSLNPSNRSYAYSSAEVDNSKNFVRNAIFLGQTSLQTFLNYNTEYNVVLQPQEYTNLFNFDYGYQSLNYIFYNDSIWDNTYIFTEVTNLNSTFKNFNITRGYIPYNLQYGINTYRDCINLTNIFIDNPHQAYYTTFVDFENMFLNDISLVNITNFKLYGYSYGLQDTFKNCTNLIFSWDYNKEQQSREGCLLLDGTFKECKNLVCFNLPCHKTFTYAYMNYSRLLETFMNCTNLEYVNLYNCSLVICNNAFYNTPNIKYIALGRLASTYEFMLANHHFINNINIAGFNLSWDLFSFDPSYPTHYRWTYDNTRRNENVINANRRYENFQSAIYNYAGDGSAEYSERMFTNGCFYNCSNLQYVNIGWMQDHSGTVYTGDDTIVLFDQECFRECQNLIKVNIDIVRINKKWGIGSSAFQNCTNLVNFYIREGSTGGALGLGPYAFKNCYNLLVLPYICNAYYNSLENCYSLTALYFRSACSNTWYNGGYYWQTYQSGISTNAVVNCTNLKSIYFYPVIWPNSGSAAAGNINVNTMVIQSNAIVNCPKLTTIYADTSRNTILHLDFNQQIFSNNITITANYFVINKRPLPKYLNVRDSINLRCNNLNVCFNMYSSNNYNEQFQEYNNEVIYNPSATINWSPTTIRITHWNSLYATESCSNFFSGLLYHNYNYFGEIVFSNINYVYTTLQLNTFSWCMDCNNFGNSDHFSNNIVEFRELDCLKDSIAPNNIHINVNLPVRPYSFGNVQNAILTNYIKDGDYQQICSIRFIMSYPNNAQYPLTSNNFYRFQYHFNYDTNEGYYDNTMVIDNLQSLLTDNLYYGLLGRDTKNIQIDYYTEVNGSLYSPADISITYDNSWQNNNLLINDFYLLRFLQNNNFPMFGGNNIYDAISCSNTTLRHNTSNHCSWMMSQYTYRNTLRNISFKINYNFNFYNLTDNTQAIYNYTNAFLNYINNLV